MFFYSMGEIMTEVKINEPASRRQSRDKYISTICVLSTIAAIISLIIALFQNISGCKNNILGYCIVSAWVLLPPIWFWAEWVYLTGEKIEKDEQDRIKHLHDLSRNIWLALIAVLIVAFDIKFKS